MRLKANVFLDPLRQEPRFQAIERELNFPDQPESVFKAGNHCGNCNFFQTAQAKGNYAPCLIFPGKSVNVNGWCRAWVAKVK